MRRAWLLVWALVLAAGVVGCKCHTSTCYDGDCGLVYDNDYFESDCGGCGVPSASSGCGGPAVSSGCGGCGAPAKSGCSGCGGVQSVPGESSSGVCAHCGKDHAALPEAPAAEQPGLTRNDPPMPELPPDVLRGPAKQPGLTNSATTGVVVPDPIETETVSPLHPEPAPPIEPIVIPRPPLEQPAPVPRDASKTGGPPGKVRWVPRRL